MLYEVRMEQLKTGVNCAMSTRINSCHGPDSLAQEKKDVRGGFIHIVLLWMEIIWCLKKNSQCKFSCCIYCVCS